MRLQNAFQIRLAEIVADKQQRASVGFCRIVRKTVAEIQRGRMSAPAPRRIDRADTQRGRSGHRDDLEAEQIDQGRHFVPDVPARCHNKRLCQRRGREKKIGIVAQNRGAARSLRFTKQDRDQRRSVDRDHFGNPVSSS